MRHQDIRHALGAGIDALLGGAIVLPHELYPYQIDTFARMCNWLRDPQGTRRGYIEHATALGKTVLYSALIHACPDLRFLVVVPTKVLIEQTAPSITRFTNGMVGHVSSLHHIYNEDGNVVALPGHEYTNVVVTTDESFKLQAAKLAREFAPHVVIWDECHWAYHASATAALAQFPEAVILGLSATPDFLTTAAKPNAHRVELENGRTLYAMPDRLAATHFETKLDERSVRWGIEEGWLAPFAWGHIAFDLSLDDVPSAETPAGTDFNERKLRELMAEHWSVMSEAIVRLYLAGEYDLPNRQTFAICPSVREGEKLAVSLRAIGLPAACITGDTPTRERRKMLARFRNGEIRFLSSVMVLREGWDAPNAEVCLMLRPTKSRVLYLQAMGRVLRRAIDDALKVALVLDAYFQRSKLMPISAPRLFAAPGQEIVDGDILVGPKPDRVRGARGVIISPYLPKEAVPRIVIVDSLDEIEYWAGPDGTFATPAGCWATQYKLYQILGVSSWMIEQRCQHGVRTMQGRTVHGKLCTFYHLEDARAACSDAIARIPRVDASGFTRHRGMRLGTPAAIRKAFRIRSRLVLTRILHQLRRVRGFDEERNLIMLHAADDVPVALHTSTTAIAHDDALATVGTLVRLLGLSQGIIEQRIAATGIPFVVRKNKQGQLRRHYSVAAVRSAAKSTLVAPRAHADGTLRDGRTRMANIPALHRILGLATRTIWLRIEEHAHRVRSREGRPPRGTASTYYAIADVRKVCADLLRRPKASPDDVLRNGGKEWVRVELLATEWGVSTGSVRLFLSTHAIASQTARSVAGIPWCEYYDAEAARAAWKKREAAPSRHNLPSVNRDGTIVMDGVHWWSRGATIKRMHIDLRTLDRLLENTPVRTMQVRGRNHKVLTAYAAEDLESASQRRQDPPSSANPPPSLPIATHGFAVLNDELWATEKAVQQRTHVHPRTFKRLVADGRVRTMQAKSRSHRFSTVTLYAIADIEREVGRTPIHEARR